jgi:hypothetical protein
MSLAMITTGGVKPLKCDSRIVLDVHHVGPNDYVDEYLCSAFGWYRSKVIGGGPTIEEAIKDWCVRTGNRLDEVLEVCYFRTIPIDGEASDEPVRYHGEELPRPNWSVEKEAGGAQEEDQG